jgi:hypothetical protein
MGWFFGFKLHLIINSKGELMNFKITKGNMSDSTPILELANGIKLGGKLFGYKGYLCKEEKRSEPKDEHNMELITKSRKNMKNKKEGNLSYYDRLLLSKRGIVETVIGQK